MNLLNKVKEKAGNAKKAAGKKIALLATTSALVVGSALSAFAAEGSSVSSTMSTTLQTSMNSMVNDFIGYVGVVLPIGLTVFGAVWGIKKAKSFFASMAKG